MSEFSHKTACPKCVEEGRDNSGDNLAVYTDGHGFCFCCGHVCDAEEDFESEPVLKPSNNKDITWISSLPLKSDPNRKLSKESMEYFGVKSSVSEVDGSTVEAHYYPYGKDGTVTSYKVRKCSDKSFYTIGDIKGVELFGQKQSRLSGGKKLFITEGEVDAISLYQALKDKNAGSQWADMNPAVISIINGSASAARDIGRNLDFVKSFESIILCFDNDDPGKKATQEVLRLIPQALVVELPLKDANDMLKAGRTAELCKAVLFNAQKHKPASVVSVEDVFDRAIKMPTWGFNWPWPSLTKLTYGIHRKKLIGLGAGVGLGKTEFAKELESYLVNVLNLPIGVIMLEEDVGRTLKGIAGKFTGKQFHKPDSNFTQEELIQGIESLRGKVFLMDHMGVKDWEEIEHVIRYMVVSEGIKDIFLDPLTAMISHLPSSSANDKLNEIMGKLSGLVHELDFTLYYFCHLNPPDSGPPHERGGKVLESQFTGSRAMMRYSHYLLGLEGNKDPELPDEMRNTRNLVLLKDREFGNAGKIPLFYNKYTGTLLEPNTSEY